MIALNDKIYLNKKGFTLIELMVVVAIIAIISIVAITLFTNVQKNARDGKRKAELEAIANVLEVNRINSVPGVIGYQPLVNTLFGSALMPGQTLTTGTAAIDPLGIPYCIATTTNAAAPAAWTATTPCTGAFVPITTTTPAAGTQGWTICTVLENPASVACRSNVQ